MKSLEQRFWTKVRKTRGCWLWTAFTDPLGYGRFGMKCRMYLAHRIAWQLANGPIPGGLCVLHRCDTPSCVRPDHLWLGTKADNTHDMVMKGRARGKITRGTQHYRAKLTEEMVRRVRDWYATGDWSQREIAMLLSMSQSMIGSIVRGENWTHVRGAA